METSITIIFIPGLISSRFEGLSGDTEPLAVDRAVITVHFQLTGSDMLLAKFLGFRQCQLVPADVAPDGKGNKAQPDCCSWSS